MQRNQYSIDDPQDISCAQERYHSLQTDELAHWLKKIYHELERANDLSEIKLKIRYMEIVREHEYLSDIDYAAMRLGLEPKKQKRKKSSCTIFDGLGGL